MKAKFYSDTTKAGIKMVIVTDSDEEAFVMKQFIDAAKCGQIVAPEYLIRLPSLAMSRNESAGANMTLRVIVDDAELKP